MGSGQHFTSGRQCTFSVVQSGSVTKAQFKGESTQHNCTSSANSRSHQLYQWDVGRCVVEWSIAGTMSNGVTSWTSGKTWTPVQNLPWGTPASSRDNIHGGHQR